MGERIERGADGIIGRCLGEFVVRERLGEGGGGTVYLAEQPLLGRDAVIKVLHAQHAGEPARIQRFLREARLASRLDHPYAAHIYAFGAESDGLLWIAMERVRGTPLDQWLVLQGPLPLDRFVPLLDRICEVVHTAHQQGIIHRDLKPANVMVLSRAGRLLPKLIDFGIAKLVDEPSVPQDADSGPRRVVELERTMQAGQIGQIGQIGLAGQVGSMPASSSGPTISVGSAGSAGSTAVVPALPTMPSTDQPITRRGLVTGSPHFMAPEQWVNAAEVDARTDLYALAALTYEALTGRHAFTGATIRELARAHAKASPPSLGGHFPLALDAVLARALAKRPADRFATALDFAAAFRAAAGLAEPTGLPELDETLQASVLTGAPQPLAEAVARLDAARNVHQAREAMWQVRRVAARYLGLVALAARGRLGGEQREAEPLATLLRTLRQRGLGDEEWVTLARETCRPFATRPEGFPIPEMVSFFFPSGSGAASGSGPAEKPPEVPEVPEVPEAEEIVDQFSPLLAWGSPSDLGGSEEEVRQQLGAGLRALEGLLRGLDFLADYPLVVHRGGGNECWTGVRRSSRALLVVRGQPLPDGQPVLVGRDGVPLLSLWPLFQVAAPTPGAAEELFLLEGRGRGAGAAQTARLVSLPSGFERADEGLWAWFASHLFDDESTAESAAAEERAPYRGLAVFSAADSDRFFGREREVEAARNRLRIQPLLAVVGPSGTGKSSFVQAGVLPALGPEWQTIVVRPGTAPLAALAARLLRDGLTDTDLRATLEEEPERLGAVLREAAARRPIVLLVDQFEELFTLCGETAERNRYAEALAGAARSTEEPVRIVLTLRDDFLLRAEQLRSLRDRLAQGLQLLTTPAPEDLVRILVEPARRAGYTFEDPELPREMVAPVADQPGALALLSFTAGRLWELRDRHFRVFARQAYRQLGGVGGALAHHAEEVLAALPTIEQRLVRETFRHLVTGEGTRAVLTRGELLQLLGGGHHAVSVVERLVAARLLLASEGEAGEERIEVIHEALLSAWPRLVEWRSEDHEGARLRDQFRAAARQWDERGRPRGLLWRDEALVEYRRWRVRHPGPLTGLEEAFEQAILAEERRRRRNRWLSIATPLVVLSIGLVAVAVVARQERASAHEAKDRLLTLYEEQGRQAMIAGDPVRAVAYLNEALQGGKDDPGLRFLLARATHALSTERAVLRGHQGRVWSAQFSPDGTLIATASGDGTARLWAAGSSTLRHTLGGHPGDVHTITFSPDGRRLITTSTDGMARLWDTGAGRLLLTLVGHGAKLGGAAFSPDGRRIATTSDDGTARVWDAFQGTQFLTLRGGGKGLRSAIFSPDGRRVLTAARDREVIAWDASTGHHLFTLERPRAESTSATSMAVLTSQTMSPSITQLAAPSFSADGSRVLTVSADYCARIWNATDGALRNTLAGHTRQLRSAVFSPDGALVVTASEDHTARLWDAHTGKPIATMGGHSESLNQAFFSPDGRRIVTVGDDGTARIWDRSGMILETLVGHLGRILSASFDPSGHFLVTASYDNTARLWNATGQDYLQSLHHEQVVWWVGYAADGQHVLTVSGAPEREVRIWDTTSGKVVSSFGPLPDNMSYGGWSRDRGTFLVAFKETVLLLDATTGRTQAQILHGARISSVAFSPDEKRIVVADYQGKAAIYDRESSRALTWLPGDANELYFVRFDREGRRVVTAGKDQTAKVWDTASGALLVSLSGHHGEVLGAAFHPDGKRLVTAALDQTAKVWKLPEGQLLYTAQEHRRQINTVDFNPDGTLFVTAGYDEKVRIWDTESGAPVGAFPAFRAEWAEFSPDGKRLAVADEDGRLIIWPMGLDGRRTEDIARFVRCRIPFRVEAGWLLPAETDPAACAGAP